MLDLGGVEFHALDLRGQLLAQILIFGLFALGEIVAHAQRVDALGLQLGEALVERGDCRELLQRLRLELLLHLGERQGIVLVIIVRWARHAALGQPVFILVGGGSLLRLVLFLERRAGTLLANLAGIVLGALYLLG